MIKKSAAELFSRAGDHFRVRLLETVSPDGIIPASMDIPVLYEDEDILVVNKPADMPVHPSYRQLHQYSRQRYCCLSGSQRRNLSIPLYQSSRPGHLRGIDSCKKRAQRRCPFRPDAKSGRFAAPISPLFRESLIKAVQLLRQSAV